VPPATPARSADIDQLLDKNLTATSFDPEAASRPLPERARTVVVGAGIVGASVAYHLARAGERDVVVLERASVAAGTSWHAAGLVSRGRATHFLTELADYGVGFYRELGDVGLRQPGSLLLARTTERLHELRYADGVARHHGIPSEIVSPARVAELHGLASAEGLVGALHQPEDGHLNPGHAALAIAARAHQHGVAFHEGVRVARVRASAGRAAAVETTTGAVECERVVLATGLWTRDLAAACGCAVPVWPAAHVHVRTAPIDGAVDALPSLRDLDGYLYVRQANGALLVGAFEPEGKPIDPHRLPADFAYGELDPDWEHFAPIRRLAEERVPALRDTEYVRFLNALESFTPDTSFCLGETAEVAGLFVAAGFNSQGIIYAPGAGRALAEWIVEGAPTMDVSTVDVQRFSRQQANRRYLHARTRESLGNLYAMHWPHLQPTTARDVRRTPLHDRVEGAGAVFGETAGYERANWYAAPGQERAYAYSYGRQNWFGRAAEEHRAAREGVALFDLSAFTKIEVAGREALDVMQWVATRNLDVPVNRVVYTLMLNARGGIVLDATVTRLADDRFLVIAPTAAHTKTLALLRRAATGRAAAIFDASAALATIAVMGPGSRDLLARITDADLSTTSLPWGRACEVEIGGGHALCLRVSFVGELGYELYPGADLAVSVYDAVVDAGRDLALRHAGYHALDSLRVEKGYRHLGHDIGPADDPYQASLAFTVDLDKPGGFLGRDAVADRASTRPDRRQVFVRLDDPEPLLLHGESVFHDGEIVGQVTSGAYGHTVGAACGLAYVHGDAPAGDGYDVDCAGTRVRATVSDTPFYDPANARLRA
jgi:4-methylaminobutanoate oxidase (formaldehyde-forming)